MMRLSRIQRILFATLAVVLTGWGFAGVWMRTLLPEENRVASPARVMVVSTPLEDTLWPGEGVWAGPLEAEGSARAARYELTGTFQVFAGESETVESAALVDDREQGGQRIVRVGDTLGPFEVGAIGEDRMTLNRGGRSWVLALSGNTAVQDRGPEVAEEAAPMNPEDLPALETTRFGKRVKENYWVLERDAVKAYIDEMMQPQNMIRTANLYRSFAQVAENLQDDNAGFRIGMKAEKDFFQDMGLQDGDIIRKANSMKMRTQRRAEYLLREFYNDRMSAVVLDVERDGEIQQHIYLVR